MERFGRQRLLDLAAAKDAGFTVPSFVDALNAIARLDDAEWAEDGVPASVVASLRSVFDSWKAALQESR